MLLAMAGLPGTGKSTVARALVVALREAGRDGFVLDKDAVRAALFPPETVEYSREQDDLCVDVMLQVATYLLQRDPNRVIILDGRTFSRTEQVAHVLRRAQAIPADVHFIECTCTEATALARLRCDREERRHPAQNRDAALYHRVKAGAEPLRAPHHFVVNTEASPEAVVAQILGGIGEQ